MRIHAQPEDISNSIVVVSGLPRSGTSMMMRMLESGGIPPLTDQVRRPDEDNPLGYYEVERIKRLSKQEDRSWVTQARGRSLKAISHLLPSLPINLQYRIIFMNRKLGEILASQNKMLARNGNQPDPFQDQKIRVLYEKHLVEIRRWLEEQPNFQILYLDYANVVAHPLEHARQIDLFLGGGLDLEAMASAVEQRLYRNRKN